MSINGLLFLNTQIRKDYERTMRVQLMKQRQEALASVAAVAAVAAVVAAAKGGLQDASSQEPNHPYDVKPWPEDARPKVDMPV